MANKLKYDGEIEFDDLMETVDYIGTVGIVKKPYILTLNGIEKAFADTTSIVPYVEKHLKIKVTYGEAFDFDA